MGVWGWRTSRTIILMSQKKRGTELKFCMIMNKYKGCRHGKINMEEIMIKMLSSIFLGVEI